MGWAITFGDGEASFFPAAGYRSDVEHTSNVGASGYYMGNAMKRGSSWLPYFYLDDVGCKYGSGSRGENALSVRCVKEQ